MKRLQGPQLPWNIYEDSEALHRRLPVISREHTTHEDELHPRQQKRVSGIFTETVYESQLAERSTPAGPKGTDAHTST